MAVEGVRMWAAAVWVGWDRGEEESDGLVKGVVRRAGGMEGVGGSGVECSGVAGVMMRMVWRG